MHSFLSRRLSISLFFCLHLRKVKEERKKRKERKQRHTSLSSSISARFIKRAFCKQTHFSINGRKKDTLPRPGSSDRNDSGGSLLLRWSSNSTSTSRKTSADSCSKRSVGQSFSQSLVAWDSNDRTFSTCEDLRSAGGIGKGAFPDSIAARTTSSTTDHSEAWREQV